MIPEYLPPLANHLWQSTVFAAVAGLLTLAFRNNRAPVRYWLWLAASVKFLIPFSLLVAVGRDVEWHTGVADPPAFAYLVENIGQPFAVAAPAVVVTPAPDHTPSILFAIWFCGFAYVVFSWSREWLRVRAAVRAASPLKLDLPIRAVTSSSRVEPGIFGIVKPVLLLPQGIAEHLTPSQLQAVVAHELCHVRRRDNLAAAVHMLVEAIFWFHPLVWWLETRLVEERERACDEHVLRAAAEPLVYAEGILNVCKLYAASPVLCVSGVTGPDLKRRIESIVNHRIARNVGIGKKLLLAAAGAFALAAPVLIGVIHGTPAQAQTQSTLAFETASIKPVDSKERPMLGVQFLPGGRLRATHVPLQMLVSVAYDLPFQTTRLTGAPGTESILHSLYDIEATAEKGSIPAGASRKVLAEKMRLMLQTLLADRFQMKIRREMKDTPVYAVVVAKNGPKLRQANIEEKDCPDDGSAAGGIRCHILNGGQGRGLHGQAVTVADIAMFVSNWTDRPTVDKSGLTGLYEVETDGWTSLLAKPDNANQSEGLPEADRPTLFTVFGQLGLKLENQRAPLDFITVERAQNPVAN